MKFKLVLRISLVLLLAFSVLFFMWSLMRRNEILDEKEKKEEYLQELKSDEYRLKYLVDAPLDDQFKIRMAREKLGMCFPDEIVYYGN